MKIYVTRDSVSAADDFHVPHVLETRLSTESIEEIITLILTLEYLPKINGGRATWSVASRKLLAIVAQEWDKPEMLSQLPIKLEDCDVQSGKLRLHFNYHAQEDPMNVRNILRSVRLTAI